MTSLITLPPRSHADPSVVVAEPEDGGRRRRALTSPLPWLLAIGVGQVALNRLGDGVRTAFDDEGLYVFMGHRMRDQLLHGTPVPEFPGSYFSGAPGIYPVLAAVADDLGGLQAVRDLSLVFVLLTTVAVYGLGAALFGRVAGILGAAVFAVCGSVIYQSAWATFDAMMMLLVMCSAWLAVTSARRNALVWGPAVAAVLALAVLTKYAAIGYAPFVLAVAVTEGWATDRWLVVRRAVFTGVATIVLLFFYLMLWGRDLLPGIAQTTWDRVIINPRSPGALVGDIVEWVGPWLLLIALGAVAVALRAPRRTPTALVLVGAAVVGPAQQVHIGELTSLAKHLAFGVAFAAPLAGYLLAWILHRRRWWTTALAVVPVTAVVAALAMRGLTLSSEFRTAYPDDSKLVSLLRVTLAKNPDRPILGEKPSAERYALRDVVAPRQWRDTYSFSYAGLSGAEAYRQAIRDHYFGVIYLNFSTPHANAIVNSLGKNQGRDHYYHLNAIVPRYLNGTRAGDWLIWSPQPVHLTPID